jgi:hypothetical protein
VAEASGRRRRGGRESKAKDESETARGEGESRRRRTGDRDAEERAAVRAAFRRLWSDLAPLLTD